MSIINPRYTPPSSVIPLGNLTPPSISPLNMSTPSSEHILNTFLDLVRIPSPSGQEAQVRSYIERRLNTLGFIRQTGLQPNQAGYMIDPTGNLILRIPSNVGSTKNVLLNTHMDVVPPCLNVKPTITIEPNITGDNRVVRSSGDTVLGGDDKAAIAPLLEALAISLKNNLPRPNLTVTFTVNEELGGAGAAKMDPRWYAQGPFRADVGLSFDINGPQGTVVSQAPQLTLWDANVQGKSAHSGIEPEKGISALQAAALAASRIRTGRLDPDTTANVGKFESGDKFNIIPGSAKVAGEIRSFNAQRVSQEINGIQQAFTAATQQIPGSGYQLKTNTLFNAYNTNLNQPIFEPLKQALRGTGLPLQQIRTNGGSDANIFSQQGIPCVVLSGAYNEPHQKTESVRVQDMKTQAQLMLNIFQKYAV